MAEYAGYVPQTPVNFGEIASGLASDIISIKEQARKEDMELAAMGYKRRQEQQKQFQEDLSKFGKVEKTVGKSFNDFATKTTRGIADNYFNAFTKYQKGEMTANELALYKNNLMGVQDGLGAFAKSFNSGMDVINKESQKQSPIGLVMGQMYANAGDYTNKSLQVAPDGSGLLYYTDDNGKVIKEETPIDPSSIPAYTQFQDYAKDYEKDLNEWSRSLGKYDVENGKVTISSPKNNPQFNKAKSNKIQELVGTEKDAARFLTQVAGFGAYNSEQQKQQLLNQGYTEDKLIKVTIGKGGFPQPIITPEQSAIAQKLAGEQIDQRISYERKEDEPRINVRVGAEKPLTEAKTSRQGYLNTAKDIYKSIYEGGKASSGAVELADVAKNLGWSDIKVGNYTYQGKVVPGKIVIRGIDEYGEPQNKMFTNEEDVFKFLYPKDKRGEAPVAYDIAVEESKGKSTSRTNQSLGTFKYKNANFDLNKIASDHGFKTKEQAINFIKNNF